MYFHTYSKTYSRTCILFPHLPPSFNAHHFPKIHLSSILSKDTILHSDQRFFVWLSLYFDDSHGLALAQIPMKTEIVFIFDDEIFQNWNSQNYAQKFEKSQNGLRPCAASIFKDIERVAVSWSQGQFWYVTKSTLPSVQHGFCRLSRVSKGRGWVWVWRKKHAIATNKRQDCPIKVCWCGLPEPHVSLWWCAVSDGMHESEAKVKSGDSETDRTLDAQCACRPRAFV